MASPYQVTNTDIQFINAAGQDFRVFLAFLNPVAFTTLWTDLNQDSTGNWLPPGNTDTAHEKIAPYCPIANMGSNRIGFVGEPLSFCGLQSAQRFDLPVNSYAWSATGMPDETLYAGDGQVVYTWNTSGVQTVTLTVTDRAGTSQSTTRQVMIYADRESALPGLLTLSGPSGSLANGGWQIQITTVNSQFTLYPPDALPVGTYQPLVIMVETRYEVSPGVWMDATVGPHGQFNPGAIYEDPRILFDGYIQTGSVHEDIDKDTLSFTCTNLQFLLSELQAHMVGYYNCAYSGFDSHGVPTGCKTSSLGNGFQVGGLMTNDIVQSILQYHSNISQYHDIHLWNSLIPCAPFAPGTPNAYYNQQFSTLSVNEGSLWQNIQDLTTNEWSQAYCDRDGSLRIGPQINYRGSEFWGKAWQQANPTASQFLNLFQDLGYALPAPSALNDPTNIPAALPNLPAQSVPITFVHEWGHQQLPSPYYRPFQGDPDPTTVEIFNAQNGPPLLCIFGDSPTYDPSANYPAGGLLPEVIYNWPQDLTIYALDIDIQENYSGRSSLVKLIGTLANAQTLLTSWYPVSTFQVTGDGVSTTVASVLPAGSWDVDSSHVIPDVTAQTNRALVLNYWWEMAHRLYFANNLAYNVTLTLGLVTFPSLSDIVGVTNQQATLGPRWVGKPFYVDGISFAIDVGNKTWQTTMTLTEITSATIGPIQAPPAVIPKW